MSNYTNRATFHRPTDRDSLAREARRLRAQGLSVFDIAHVMRLTAEGVRALLNVREVS